MPQLVVILMSRMGGEARYARSLFMPVVFVFVAVEAAVSVTTRSPRRWPLAVAARAR
ncbi:hypothetical protein [Streptomyces sp. 7-21]|uniref:hypothetical protein n=1 Tax=Streptomyces sp. 7-21 TaxID=2802283 RepID=UPI001F2C4823|nr:hypothetical protein [Streptomyces sp. 7-21]